MFKELDIDEVAPDLWVGPYPSNPEFVNVLAEDLKISGQVSVQTNEDLGSLGVNWPAMKNYIKNQGIDVVRLPIRDFDARALERGLTEAVGAVHFFKSMGRITYLHCTAGLNRSPSVAIAYLMAHQNMKLDKAWDQVTGARRCMPVRKVLKRWYKGYLKSLKQ